MCCRLFTIRETAKGPNEPCPRLCESGCSDYEDRPEVCARFECLWLEGMFSIDERPDIVGAICNRLHVADMGVDILSIRTADLYAQGFLDSQISKGFIVKHTRADETVSLLGRKDLLARFVADVREKYDCQSV